MLKNVVYKGCIKIKEFKKEEEQIATMQKAGIAITRPEVAPFRDKMAPAYDVLRKSIGDENWNNWSRAVAAAKT